jgi:hypothetical protein
VDIPQFALAVENFLRPFPGHAEALGEGAEELNDLRDVIVVFAVLCAGLGVEEVVAGDEFECLCCISCQFRSRFLNGLTIAAILQTSVLAPHLLPKMTSGDLYCLVWMSFVKWCPTQQAFPRSAILTEIVSNAFSTCCSNSVFPEGLLDLSRLMPDTSFVRRSLTRLAMVSMSDSSKLTQSSRVASARRPRCRI